MLIKPGGLSFFLVFLSPLTHFFKGISLPLCSFEILVVFQNLLLPVATTPQSYGFFFNSFGIQTAFSTSLPVYSQNFTWEAAQFWVATSVLQCYLLWSLPTSSSHSLHYPLQVNVFIILWSLMYLRSSFLILLPQSSLPIASYEIKKKRGKKEKKKKEPTQSHIFL